MATLRALKQRARRRGMRLFNLGGDYYLTQGRTSAPRVLARSARLKSIGRLKIMKKMR